MKRTRLFLIVALFPIAVMSQDAPWGMSLMQVGAKTSWYITKMNEDGNYNQSNFSVGPSARAQVSLLDFLLYDDQKFRMVDVIGFEVGTGYQKSKTIRNDQYDDEDIVKKMWLDFGIDLGLLAKVRVIPKLDIGIKYLYLSQMNSTFNFPKSHSAYGNAMHWAASVRYDKFYADVNIIRGKDSYPTHINVFDLKYTFSEKGSWLPYVGIQVGVGKTSFESYGTDFISSRSRNWIQISVGKMTNF